MRFFSAFKLRQKFFPELKAGAKPVDGFQEFYERNAPNQKIWGVRTLKKYASSHIQTILSVSEFANTRHRFIHPKVVADYTAGGDLHPAPKNSCIGFCENCLTNLHKTYYIGLWGIVNIQLLLFYFFGQ